MAEPADQQVDDGVRNPVTDGDRVRFKPLSLPFRLVFALGLGLPFLLWLLPEAALVVIGERLGGGPDAVFGLAYALQALSIIVVILTVVAMNGRRFGLAFLVATLKSVAFAVFVGAPFCVGLVFLALHFLPCAPIWLQILAGVGPTIALVVAMSFWFSRDLQSRLASRTA
jgi:hypothetical protein